MVNWKYPFVFVATYILPVSWAQSNASMIGRLRNSSTLVTLTHGMRDLAYITLNPGSGLPANFSLFTNYSYGFVSSPSCSTSSFSYVFAKSPTDIILNITLLAPGTYHLCFEGVLQTIASPWLTINEGGGDLQAYYWCGNWTAQVLTGIIYPPPPARFSFFSKASGYVTLPNDIFSTVVSSESECVLVFECDYCYVSVKNNNENTSLLTYLQAGANVVEPAALGFSFAHRFRLKNSDDVVVSTQTRGSGSTLAFNATFTFRLLARVIYRELRGSVPPCARQTEDLMLTAQFGRDVPGGAALLLFFPLGTELISIANLSVTFGSNNIPWLFSPQSTPSVNYFILPLLGRASSNSVIPANTDVSIRFSAGSLAATGVYYSKQAKIFMGFYFPLVLQADGSVPIDFAVNPEDAASEIVTFPQPFISGDIIKFTPVQSASCDRTFSINLFAPFALDFNDRFLISFSPSGKMQFRNSSNIYPHSFVPVVSSSLQGEEIRLFTDTRYQQLLRFENVSTNKTVCSNISLVFSPNSTFCSFVQNLGESVSNFSLLLLNNGSIKTNFSSFVGTIFIASPAPTQQPTLPTAAPSTQAPTQAKRPCPSQTEFSRIRNSTNKNAPSCEVNCSLVNIAFLPSSLTANATVLCGLSDPQTATPVLSSLGKNPPEPQAGGVRLSEVIDISLVHASGRVITVPQNGKVLFTLPLLNVDETQNIVWRSKNKLYVELFCEFYNRTEGVWSAQGCRRGVVVPFSLLGPERKGVGCECTHMTEFAVIARYVLCKAEYVEWAFGAVYSLCTFFALIQVVRIVIHPRGDNIQANGGKCDVLLIHHFLLAVVGVLRAVGMFARCDMFPEVRVFLVSLPYALLLAQFLLIFLIWAPMALFSLEINPFLKLKWMFVVVSIITLLFIFALPGLVVLDAKQDAHSTVTVFASWAVGALDCAAALLSIFVGSSLACVLRRKDVAAETRFGKFAGFSIAIGIFFAAECALWALTIDEFSLAQFGVFDSIYRACDIIVFLLLLVFFMGPVTVRSKTVSHSVLSPSSNKSKNSVSTNNSRVAPNSKTGGRRSVEMSRSKQGV